MLDTHGVEVATDQSRALLLGIAVAVDQIANDGK